MNNYSQTNKKIQWPFLLLFLIIVIGAIATVWLTHNKPPSGSPQNTSSPLIESTKSSTPTDPTPQNEASNELTPTAYTPESTSIPDILTPQMTYEVIQTYPHDPEAFTQGLVMHEGYFYESTGLYGQSSLRKVEIETGQVLEQRNLSSEYFGEGLTIWENKLIQLTWRENVGFVFDLRDFSPIEQFNYLNEGWGLTHDGEHLIQSDGTATLSFLDPETYQIISSVTVTDQDTELDQLNELEYIEGEIFANIWQTDHIVRIDPDTGVVLGWIDLAGILPEDSITSNTDVLNGIAYDEELNRLFITGKNWPLVFEIRLIPKP